MNGRWYSPYSSLILHYTWYVSCKHSNHIFYSGVHRIYIQYIHTHLSISLPLVFTIAYFIEFNAKTKCIYKNVSRCTILLISKPCARIVPTLPLFLCFCFISLTRQTFMDANLTVNRQHWNGKKIYALECTHASRMRVEECMEERRK